MTSDPRYISSAIKSADMDLNPKEKPSETPPFTLVKLPGLLYRS